MTHAVALALVGLGVGVAVLSSLGALSMGRDRFVRLHFLTPLTSVAGPLVGAGLCLENGWGLTTGQIILVVVMLLFSGPVISSATGRYMAQQAGEVDSASPE